MHLHLAGAGRVGRIRLREVPLGGHGSVFPRTRRSCKTRGAEVALSLLSHPPQPARPSPACPKRRQSGGRMPERGSAGLWWAV